MYALPIGPFEPSDGFGMARAPSFNSFGQVPVPSPGLGGNATSNVVPLPTAAVPSVHATLALLRRFKKHAHNADPKSFKFAEEFLGLAAGARRPFKFSAQIFADGNAVLVLRSEDIAAQFEFLPNGVIAANIDRGSEEWDDDVPGFDGRMMPEAIAEKLGIGVRV